MANKEPGYVYILTNPSFREDWIKIGKTTNMEERLRISKKELKDLLIYIEENF